uniref:DUF4789 domain-containing protein n=1 Tax=Lepeophtheirus salmonis TaxID=72036 RepID=A0A0K2U1A8_LEPSM
MEKSPYQHNNSYLRTLIYISLICNIFWDFSSGSRHCRAGSVYWGPTDYCYPMDTRGPCPKNKIIIEKPEGALCIPDYRPRIQTIKDHIRNRVNDMDNTIMTKKISYPSPQLFLEPQIYSSWLPKAFQMSHKERECYDSFMVYVEQKDRCFPLLSSEACESHDEWLVLEADEYSGEVRIICKKKPCPCHDLDLCEVDTNNGTYSHCKGKGCVVSRAAYQSNICKPNEQLLIDPYGHGKCGCLRDPYHVNYEDECFLLYSQGPCEEGFMLQYSPLLKSTECTPEICPDTSILYMDGHCYFLGTKGPCENGYYFDVDPKTKELACHKFANKREILKKRHSRSPVKRVFDIMPKGGRPPGCIMDSRGTCRDIIDFEDSRIGKRQKQSGRSLFMETKPPEMTLMYPVPESITNAEEYVKWLRDSRSLPPSTSSIF